MSANDTGTPLATPDRRPPAPKPRPVVLESGIEVQPVYGPADVVEGAELPARIGEPGAFPFTRGIHPMMYRRRPWTMRQYAGFGTPKDTNERFRFLIANGQTGLNVAFDLPTQCGFDSDDPMAQDEVGRVGMAVDSLEDLEIAFADIPLDTITVSLTINSQAPFMIAAFAAMARKRGFALEGLRGTAQNDILKEFVARGTWVYPVGPSVRLVGDTIAYCAEHLPKYSPVSVCGYHLREAGANPAQEMGFAFEIARVYVQETLRRGIPIDTFAGRLSFNFDIFGNLWEQVAKFRAGRRVWATLVKDTFGASNPKSQWMRMIAGGGGGGLTIEEPENNIVRGAYYALASALAGTQTMALCSYDEAYTIPTPRAAKLSLRTMQILADEVGLTDTVDPLGGSYFVEALTDQMEARIVEAMESIAERGGMAKAVQNGHVQNLVSRQAYLREQRIQAGEIVQIAVNKYRDDEPGGSPGGRADAGRSTADDDDARDDARDVALHPYDPEQARAQVARLDAVRNRRDEPQVAALLARLREVAASEENVMPVLVEAVNAYATLGEINQAFLDVFGRFQEPPIV